jgi:hypothetical protein
VPGFDPIVTPRTRSRAPSAILALCTLAALIAWLGGGWFHHHPAAAPCEVCKVLHAAHAALPSEADTSDPAFVAKPLALQPPEGHAEPLAAHPLSRGPPLS